MVLGVIGNKAAREDFIEDESCKGRVSLAEKTTSPEALRKKDACLACSEKVSLEQALQGLRSRFILEWDGKPL